MTRRQAEEWQESELATGEIVRHYATKAELLQLEIRWIKWAVGLILAAAVAGAGLSALIVNVFRTSLP